MKRAALLTCAVICFLLTAMVSVSGKNSPPQGYWEGRITYENKVWRVAVTFQPNAGGWIALADFPDVGGYARQFTVSFENPHIHLERPQPSGIPIIFDGRLDGNKIQGDWTGFGHKATFSLHRSRQPPAPFREEEVTFRNGDVRLSGTLVLPSGPGTHPALVCIHGGGPDDREKYRSIAVYFARHGIAALIYDKRGVGKSSGDWQVASMDDLAGDALAGVRLLKNHPQINPRQVGVEGVSQGGWVCPLAAAKSSDVAFVIVLSACGSNPMEQSIFNVRNDMHAAGFSSDVIEQAINLRRRLYETVKTGEGRPELNTELEKVSKEPWFASSGLPYPLAPKVNEGVKEFLLFEPIPIWERVSVPVLAMWGEKDTNLPAARSRELVGQALRRAGNKDFTLNLYMNADHGLVLVRDSNNSDWDFPRLATDYNEAMAEWIRKRFVKS